MLQRLISARDLDQAAGGAIGRTPPAYWIHPTLGTLRRGRFRVDSRTFVGTRATRLRRIDPDLPALYPERGGVRYSPRYLLFHRNWEGVKFHSNSGL